MLKQLSDVINGKEGNYLLPFFWQRGTNRDDIPAQLKRVYDTGTRAITVESRVHKDFCGKTWWEDMDVILSEAEKLGMKVWLLDDSHFPTGSANGLLEKKYPHLRAWHLCERHIDIMGPQKSATMLFETSEDRVLLGAYAYKRVGYEEDIIDNAIDVTQYCHGTYLNWDVPDGMWRVFFIYKAQKFYRPGCEYYIDPMNAESVHVLIEAVYETHYEHYSKYFGKTFAGFFSDEPMLNNDYYLKPMVDKGMFDMGIGQYGLSLPWNDDMVAELTKILGRDAMPCIPGVWYNMVGSDISSKIRCAYMDIITRYYSERFTQQLGKWSRDHGVMYIGHIIEDMNCSAHTGTTGGHYFRALDGQDMSGMDIVLHQVMPGYTGYKHSSTGFGGYADPEFFQYVLANLCGSMAQVYPNLKKRAMCEVFGAYGWSEGTPVMKWLVDYLLVNGVNHLVPHAFSPDFPDEDCPPHFGALGHDPQYDGFCSLMHYANKACHLLYGTDHISDAAILYQAEAEWYNAEGDMMLMQKPAYKLSQNHISYEIIPYDVIAGKVGDIPYGRYKAIVVPYAKKLPQYVLDALYNLKTKVIFINARPEGCNFGDVSTIESLPEKIKPSVKVEGNPELRIYASRRGETTEIMFFNSSTRESVDTTAWVPATGRYCRLDILNDNMEYGTSDDGKLEIKLAPYQSVIYDFDNTIEEPDTAPAAEKTEKEFMPVYKISLFDAADFTDPEKQEFIPYKETADLFDITAFGEKPGFSGKMRYEASFDVKNGEMPVGLDLGTVGQTARVTLNGKDLGIRICQPYSFDISGAVREGENKLMIEVSNTLANQVQEYFSYYLPIPASGLIGPVKLAYFSK